MSTAVCVEKSGKISQNMKIDILFNYIFSYKKAKDEEFFWNSLKEKEIIQLNKIKQEPINDITTLKKKILGK